MIGALVRCTYLIGSGFDYWFGVTHTHIISGTQCPRRVPKNVRAPWGLVAWNRSMCVSSVSLICQLDGRRFADRFVTPFAGRFVTPFAGQFVTPFAGRFVTPFASRFRDTGRGLIRDTVRGFVTPFTHSALRMNRVRTQNISVLLVQCTVFVRFS